MASHKGWDEVFPVTSVATSGGSFNVGKSQLALVNTNKVTAKDGLAVISSLSGLSKDTEFQLRVGKHGIRDNRSQSSKDWSSQTFKIGQVLDLKVDAPTLGIETDEIILGYDGINADTAIVLGTGENEVIAINLAGEVIGAIGFQDANVEVKLYLEQDNVEDNAKTMQEIIETAVIQFNELKVMGDIPINTYVTAVPVNSTNAAASGTDADFYTLTLQDEGDSNAEGLVQSQYPDTKVEKTAREGLESIYTVVATSLPTAYSFNKAWKVKGCASCPSGYSAFSDGWIYSIDIEDNGGDSTALIEATFSNIEADSAVNVNVIDGVTTYTFVLTGEIVQADIDTMIAAEESAVIELVSEDVQDICSPDASVDTAWVAGDTCKTVTEAYSIQLANDKCDGSKLAALQAAYPELSIAASTTGGCQGVYTTTVVTNIVCEGCDPIFRALFSSDAPQDFQGTSWEAAAKVYDEAALMGIKFKATEVQLNGSEVYRDDMPFIASSARLSIAGGHEVNVNESFSAGTNGRFAVKLTNIASEPENWGGNLREYEDMTKCRQEGVSRHEGNNYGKWILGEETSLKANVPYVDYILTIQLDKFAQSFGGSISETIYYHYLAEPGVHKGVEDLLNTIALAAGIDPVQAYAIDA